MQALALMLARSTPREEDREREHIRQWVYTIVDRELSSWKDAIMGFVWCLNRMPICCCGCC